MIKKGAVLCCVGLLWVTTLFASTIDEYKMYFNFESKLTSIASASHAFTQIQASGVQDFLNRESRLTLARYLTEKGAYQEATSHSLRLVSNEFHDEIQEKALRLLVEIAILEKNQDKAVLQYGLLITYFPFTDRDFKLFDQIKEAFVMQVDLYDSFQGEKQFVNYLQALFKMQYFEDAKKVGIYVLKKYPQTTDKNDVLFMVGMSFFYKYGYSQAIHYFKQLLASNPNSKLKHQALYYMGRSFEEKFSILQAAATYEKLLKDKKATIWHEKALLQLTLMFKQHQQFSEYHLLAEQLSSWPNKKIKKTFKWYEYWDNMNQHKYTQPLKKDLKLWFKNDKKVWQTFLSMTSMNHPPQYWVSHIPLTYESYKTVSLINVSNYTPSRPVISWLIKRGHLNLAINQLSYSVERALGFEIENYYLLAEMYKRKKLFFKSFSTLRKGEVEAQKRDLALPHYYIKALYPRFHQRLVRKYAKKFKIDPYLLWALMKQSSQFETQSGSVEKGLGLFRIKPKIAMGLAWQMGDKWTHAKTLLNPESNIRYAAFYLSELKKRYKNDIYLVLIGFINGVKLADTYQSQGIENYIDLNQSMQFSKIREDIKIILNNYFMYTYIYQL